MRQDPLLYAIVTIAADDGVSVDEIVKRGFKDLSLRLAKKELDADLIRSPGNV